MFSKSKPIYDLPPVSKADMGSIERAFTRLFSSDDGRLVLSHLQAVTFYRVMGVDAPDTQLRYQEGQRALLGLILRLIERGRLPSRS